MKILLLIVKYSILAAIAVRVLFESIPVLILNGAIFAKGDYDDAARQYLIDSTFFELGVFIVFSTVWIYLFRYRI